MNTRFSLVLVGMDTEQSEALAAAAERDLRSCEKLLSRFDPASPVSEINRRAAEAPVAVPAELWNVLSLCERYWREMRGAFDITLWPLSRLWREHLEQGSEPSPEAMEKTLGRTGFGRLELDSAARTIRFGAAGMSLDFGGFGKGFALDRVAGTLRSHGVERAFLSFGESSITVLGTHPHGPSWPVGIANMFRPAETVHTFQLKDASLSSSGTAPFNRMADAVNSAQIFGHILDPHSGRPIPGYRTLSVSASTGAEAEVLSTALLVTPEPERAAMLSGFTGVSAVELVYRSGAEELIPRTQWKYGL